MSALSGRGRELRWALVALLCSLLAGAGTSLAHPLAPALLSLEEAADGTVDVTWKRSLLRPTGVDVTPQLPARCRRITESSFAQGPSDLTERYRVDCSGASLVGETLAIQGLDASRTDALIRVVLADGRSVRALLSADQARFEIPERESRSEVFLSYLELGVEHLLFGIDHVLFVLALVLLVRDMRTLVATITAFTVGHSITLSLAALGIVNAPASLFETAIAFSIVVLAAELARGGDGQSSALRRRPWLVSAGFGLLHGLGFAGALSEIGLPQAEVPLALFAFNVGVEIGQLMVVVPVALLLAALRKRDLYSPRWMESLPAWGIGALAGYWTLERGLWMIGL